MLVACISILLLPFLAVFSQESSNCESKETCHDCIQEIECVWCITPKSQSNDSAIHCFHNLNSSDWCSADQLISPKSSMNILQNKNLNSDTDNTVQIRPQRVKLSLRKGEKIDVHFQYKQAEDYPVDLYYIMDLSASMERHRKKLGKLGLKLAETMKKITKNFRLGFGSFIDKVDLPFVSTVESKLKSPCTLSNKEPCVSPYSFKNHLNLTNDYDRFTSHVTAAKVSGNLDTPEGGFDAIMQAIVCKQIGWRPQARHLLVFSTDAEFHIAGDGKLVGVIEPNDAKCHMKDNIYTHYLVYDYPSVSQINYVAKENNVNIIFATVGKPSYGILSEHIENSNYGQLMDNDNNNVVNLVVKNYNKIVQSITLTSNSTDEVDIKFTSTCSSPIQNGCTNIHVTDTVNFTATIQPLKCSNNGEKTYISIKPEALNESLIIELEVLCNCSCSSPSHPSYQLNSNECTGNGNLECGVCNCAPGRFGRNCQCDSSVSTTEDVSNCRMSDQSDICSNLGECKCGKCECNVRPNREERIYGKFCQCSNHACKREGGLLCSGKGTCDCGECKCQAGYTGDACQCPDTNSTCIAPRSNVICSEHGKCECGQCLCNVDDGFSGKFCEECATCPAQRCEELRHCVECQAYETGIYDKNKCLLECTAFKTNIVEKFDDDDRDAKKCRVPDKAGCIMIFEYTYDENGLIVTAQKEKLCAAAPNVLAWILGVIGTILLAGLIMLIIWKLCTTIHDRREYAKFENERKGLKWHRNDNPLYKDAVSTFANPVYNRSSSKSSDK